MAFELPNLPYALDALSPVISRELLTLHYDKHHRGYVNKLNGLVRGTDLENKSLEELIVNVSVGDIFNNAAQAWNHSFFWRCLSPSGGGIPGGHLAEIIGRQFGSLDNFVGQFSEAASNLFGSGWVWLARLSNGALSIEMTQNADNPLGYGHRPLLALDVWEHAYYIDYLNDRAAYVRSFWEIVDWRFVESQLGEAEIKRSETLYEGPGPRDPHPSRPQPPRF